MVTLWQLSLLPFIKSFCPLLFLRHYLWTTCVLVHRSFPRFHLWDTYETHSCPTGPDPRGSNNKLREQSNNVQNDNRGLAWIEDHIFFARIFLASMLGWKRINPGFDNVFFPNHLEAFSIRKTMRPLDIRLETIASLPVRTWAYWGKLKTMENWLTLENGCHKWVVFLKLCDSGLTVDSWKMRMSWFASGWEQQLWRHKGRCNKGHHEILPRLVAISSWTADSLWKGPTQNLPC